MSWAPLARGATELHLAEDVMLRLWTRSDEETEGRKHANCR